MFKDAISRMKQFAKNHKDEIAIGAGIEVGQNTALRYFGYTSQAKKKKDHLELFPVRISVAVDDKTASVVAYVTRGELDRIIENPNIDFEIED